MQESSLETVCQRKECISDSSLQIAILSLWAILYVTCRGEVYPIETDIRLCDILQTGMVAVSISMGMLHCSKAATPGTIERAQALLITSSAAGQEVEVDLENDILTDIASGKQYPLKSIGEVCRFLYLTGTLTIWESTMSLVQQAVTLCCKSSVTLWSLCLQAGPVVDAGGIFEYARQTGMIKQAATA